MTVRIKRVFFEFLLKFSLFKLFATSHSKFVKYSTLVSLFKGYRKTQKEMERQSNSELSATATILVLNDDCLHYIFQLLELDDRMSEPSRNVP